MIVAYPAGGNTDIGARILAAIAEKEFGQPVVVVNKGGAGGQLGFTEGARAKPDGYTVTFINLPAVSTIVLDPERKAAFEQEMAGRGRVLIRYSGTESLARVMIEGADGPRIRAMADDLAGLIRTQIGDQ